MTKERLDVMMQNRGLAESRTLAQKLIMAGEVRVNGNMIIKPSQQFQDDVEITVEKGPQFVSRGGEKLLGAFNALVERGHSIVVVEHNLDVIRAADWVIDLGPDAGAEGGRVVFEGTPEALAKADTWTGRALREETENQSN